MIKRLAGSPRHLAIAIISDMLACGLLYSLIENKGPIQGQWWAIVTASTVGYGDQYPATVAGRGLGAFLIISMWWLSILAGAQVTAKLIQDPDIWTDEEQKQMQWLQLKQLEILEAILYDQDPATLEVIQERFKYSNRPDNLADIYSRGD